jgi:hypothetical protein|tara:strand:- start:244 stop:600 length:357 start_codon:yes stop_codon:yes gene_type:complete
MSDDQIQLKRKAKGPRPLYFNDPDIDRLLAMLMGLVGEVCVIRDRLDTLERLADKHDLISQQEIEDFVPSEAVLQERATMRDTLLGEVTRVVSGDIEDLQNLQLTSYENAIKQVEGDR